MFNKSIMLALAATTLFATPAYAEVVDHSAISVPYTDLNLTSEKGQKILERRLDRAARDVCGMDDQTTGRRTVNHKVYSCYRQARATSARQFAELLSNTRKGG